MARVAWHGIEAHKTDAEAYKFAELLWGLPPSLIILKRTGGAILLHPNVGGGAVDDDLNLYIKRRYPPPEPGDPLYQEYKQFGHWAYLIKAYPDDWDVPGATFAAMFESERQDMYWEQIEEETGPINGEIGVLEQFLRGNSIVALKAPMHIIEGQGDMLDAEGVAVWEEENGKVMCIFTDDEGSLIPRLMYPFEIDVTDDEFEGW